MMQPVSQPREGRCAMLKWMWPLPGAGRCVPTEKVPGAFGAERKYDIHCGVDLYCEKGQPCVAVEDGRIVCLEIFTGPDADPPTPWWNQTFAVYVEGASGVVVYGEIEIDQSITISQNVKRGQKLGTVMTVLKKDKGLPMTMLHLELHKPGTRRAVEWELRKNMPISLMDPTNLLIESTDE